MEQKNGLQNVLLHKEEILIMVWMEFKSVSHNMRSLSFYRKMWHTKNTLWFMAFSNAMDLPWDPYILPKDHIRYSSVTKWKNYPILGKHIDWVIMGFIEKGTCYDEYESFHIFIR